MKLGEIVSSLEIEDRHAYLWVKPMGLIALNLDSQGVEWAFNAVPAQSNNYNLLVEGDTVFFSSKSIFAVDKKSGSLIWQSEYEDSKSGVHITVLNNYVLYYDMETDDEVPPLTAIDKQTGKMLYQYFTSETYPQDFENERGLNSLDYATMKFVRGAYENMIFGTYQDKIYAFEILKRQ